MCICLAVEHVFICLAVEHVFICLAVEHVFICLAAEHVCICLAVEHMCSCLALERVYLSSCRTLILLVSSDKETGSCFAISTSQQTYNLHLEDATHQTLLPS